jgi:hypothetical protein
VCVSVIEMFKGATGATITAAATAEKNAPTVTNKNVTVGDKVVPVTIITTTASKGVSQELRSKGPELCDLCKTKKPKAQIRSLASVCGCVSVI